MKIRSLFDLSVFIVGVSLTVSAVAECGPGKTEVMFTTPSCNSKTLCLPESALLALENASDQAANNVPFARAAITPLGDLEGGQFGSVANAISPNGCVVVGHSNTEAPRLEAFRWSAKDGMLGLGHLYTDISTAKATSEDGGVVVGISYIDISNGEAFRWTAETGMVGLGFIGGAVGTSALDVSADGSVIVGVANYGFGGEAVRWTASGGMVGLGDLDGSPPYFSGAVGVSADGTIIVGSAYSVDGLGWEPFRWTASDGMVGLGRIDGISAYANGISSDGRVIVGYRGSETRPFRWTANDGMVILGDVQAQAFAVSADGSVIVGEVASGPMRGAFRWTAESGMQNVKALLEAAGVDMTGWYPHRATGVSDDGNIIVGYGGSPNGYEAFLAVLPH